MSRESLVAALVSELRRQNPRLEEICQGHVTVVPEPRSFGVDLDVDALVEAVLEEVFGWPAADFGEVA